MKSGIKAYFIMFILVFYAVTYKLNTYFDSKNLLIIFSIIRISLTFILILIIMFNSIYKVIITMTKYELSLTSSTTIFNIFSEENSRIILRSTFYSIPYIIIGIYLNSYINITNIENQELIVYTDSLTYSLSNLFSIDILRFNSIFFLFFMFFIYFVILVIYIMHKFFESIKTLVIKKRFFEIRIKKMNNLIKIISFKILKFINFIYKIFFIFAAIKFLNKIKAKFYFLLKLYKKGNMPPKTKYLLMF